VRYTLAALVENHFGVLARVAGLFSRRGYNIESLAVGPTEDPSVSRMTIVMDGDARERDQMVRQLDKLVDVIRCAHIPGEDMVARELALIKVSAEPERRPAITQIVEMFRAKVVDVGHRTLTVEITGDEQKVNALIEMMGEFGIEEVARTGLVALARGANVMRLAAADAPVEEAAR
jgi:acetolactate synthase-1/3 small subunit